MALYIACRTGATPARRSKRSARWSSKSGFSDIWRKTMKAIPAITADSSKILRGKRSVLIAESLLNRMKIKK